MAASLAVAEAQNETALDLHLLAAWHRHCGLQESLRLSRRQAAVVRAELAALLVEKRDSLTGAAGGFDAWLRLHEIPRSTAYHLIGLHLNGRSLKKTKVQPVSNLDTPLNSVQLDGQVLSLRLALTSRQAAVIAGSLAALDEAQRRPGAKTFDLGEHLATSLAAAISGGARTQIQRLRRLPDSSFPASPAAHPPIRFCPTPPAAPAARISTPRFPSSESHWQPTTDGLRDNLHALSLTDERHSPDNWSFHATPIEPPPHALSDV